LWVCSAKLRLAIYDRLLLADYDAPLGLPNVSGFVDASQNEKSITKYGQP